MEDVGTDVTKVGSPRVTRPEKVSLPGGRKTWQKTKATLSSISMVQWKMGPSNFSFLSCRVIFHFRDYARKGIYGQIYRKPCKT